MRLAIIPGFGSLSRTLFASLCPVQIISVKVGSFRLTLLDLLDSLSCKDIFVLLDFVIVLLSFSLAPLLPIVSTCPATTRPVSSRLLSTVTLYGRSLRHFSTSTLYVSALPRQKWPLGYVNPCLYNDPELLR